MKCLGCGARFKSESTKTFPVFQRVGMVLKPMPHTFACAKCVQSGAAIVCTSRTGVRG
jgi:hypothetical protein